MKSNFTVLNLKPWINHKAYYKQENFKQTVKKELFEIYLMEPFNGIQYETPEIRNEYLSEFNAENIYDNVVCEGQLIEFTPRRVDEILIIGYCDFGTVSDYLNLSGDDDTEKCEFVMKTIQSDSWQGIENNKKNINCKTAFSLLDDEGQKHKIYYWKIKPKNQLTYKAISLPFNISIHIISIVLF